MVGSFGVAGIAGGAELFEHAGCLFQMFFGDRARSRLRDEATEREMAQRRLIALAKQIEERRALREVVVRVSRAPASCVQSTTQTQVLTPRSGSRRRIESYRRS